MSEPRNVDQATVVGFGDDSSTFDQTPLAEAELDALFGQCFDVFPWKPVGADAVGFGLGCDSGSGACRVAPRAGAPVRPARRAPTGCCGLRAARPRG